MNIKNLKVGARLSLAFGAVLLLLVVQAAVGLFNMNRMNARLEDMVSVNMQRTKVLTDMSDAVHIVSRVMRTVVVLEDHDAKLKENEKIVNARKLYDESFAALEKTPAISEAGKALRAKIRADAEVARALNNKVIELGLANKTAEAAVLLMKEAAPATQKWHDALEEDIKLQEEDTKSDAQDARKAYNNALVWMLTVGGLAVLVGALAAYLITRSITRQLGGEPDYAAEITRRVADGDLTTEIVTRKGDSTSLLASMKKMQDSLGSTVSSIKESTDSITSASGQIAAGNADLSQRTEEQAASLEETASSMEELTSTVKQNADNARQANQLAAEASSVAVKGGQVVGQVVGTMSSINDSSKKIVDIISVIDGIAFQTNILALNAAVEAARAGEQGRGFAVVASEVRSLAQRSAAAAKEIKGLITDSVGKVQDGTRLVGEAGKTMDEIVTSVKRVTDIMAEIAAASQEQSSGIEQVNQAVMQMDEVTQQNAALVEEAAAAAESLQEQAQSLTQAVSVFKAAPGEVRVAVQAPRVPRTATVTAIKRRKPAEVKPAANAETMTQTRKVANAKGAEAEWQEF